MEKRRELVKEVVREVREETRVLRTIFIVGLRGAIGTEGDCGGGLRSGS